MQSAAGSSTGGGGGGGGTSLSEGAASVIAEKLMKTVSRAFYTDGVVVVLDALLREKYIREEELGPRLRLQEKEVRKIITRLEDEMLVKCESILMEDMRQSKCFYVDYQTFVDVVRYRVYLMDKAVSASENDEISETKYKCPTCSAEVNSLEAQRCKSKDYKFICSSCCPHENFRELIAEPYYRLVPLDIDTKVKTAKSIKTRLSQMLQSSPEHDGIYDLLRELKDAPLKRNLPSENMSKGFRASEVKDEDSKMAIAENLGRQVLGKKNRYLVSDNTAQRETIGVTLKDTDNSILVSASSMTSSTGARSADDSNKRRKVEKSAPDFLTKSGVHGASSVYQLASLNAAPASESKGEAAQNEEVDGGGENVGGEGDDIAWEDVDDEDDDDEDDDEAME